MLGTILFATDASSNHDAVIACAHRLAIRNGSKVVVVFVGAASSVSRRSTGRSRTCVRRAYLFRLAVVADGRDKASVIAHMATAWSADLVMVGGGGSGVDLDLAQRVAESSACPILAVPAKPASVSPPVRAAASLFRGRS